MGWSSVLVTQTLFFYGSLCHLPLLHVVLGRTDVATEQASLVDHAVHWVSDENYPTIHAKAGERAVGIVVQLTGEDVARLNYYEGAFSYDLQSVQVEISGEFRTADVYFPTQNPPLGEPWVLDNWVEKFGRVNVEAAKEIMSYYGSVSMDEVTKRFTQIHSRAAALVRMQDRNQYDKRADRSADIVVDDARRPYSFFFTLEEHDLKVRQFDGEFSPQMTRAGFVSGDASILLPFDPERKRVLLVEQFRYGAFLAGDSDPWSIEPIAGRIDLGETAEQAARREAMEEAGIEIGELHTAARCYPSPGVSNEFFHIFVGLCELPNDIIGVGGKADEHEDIKSHLMSLDELERQLDTHQLRNAPLVVAASWLLRHHEKLSR